MDECIQPHFRNLLHFEGLQHERSFFFQVVSQRCNNSLFTLQQNHAMRSVFYGFVFFPLYLSTIYLSSFFSSQNACFINVKATKNCQEFSQASSV